jgi:hypothetical protein
VRDLYGTFHQKAYFWAVPAIYVNAAGCRNIKSDPLGVARVTVEVHDCTTGKRVFHRDLISENRFHETSLSEAARLALTDVLQKLRNETAGSLTPPSAPSPPEDARPSTAP